MIIYKCDICKKQIKDDGEKVLAGTDHHFNTYSFCGNCGKLVIAFLKKHDLIEKKKNKPKKK